MSKKNSPAIWSISLDNIQIGTKIFGSLANATILNKKLHYIVFKMNKGKQATITLYSEDAHPFTQEEAKRKGMKVIAYVKSYIPTGPSS